MSMKDLRDSNPAETDHDWGSSEAGRALFASLQDRIDDEVAIEPPAQPARRPWVYAIAGFAVVILAVGLPLLFRGEAPTEQPVGGTFQSATSAEEILADNFVTDAELELAAQATVDCINEQAQLGEGAGWDWDDTSPGVVFTTDAGEGLFNQCHGKHFRQIEFVWAAQNAPEPAEGFYFYGAVVRCAEGVTGGTFGMLSQDSLGFMSTEGQRTVDRALVEARSEYLDCFDRVADTPPTHYYFVLECVTEATGTEYPSLVDAGPGRLTAEHIMILDGARAEHSAEFDRCQREVALD